MFNMSFVELFVIFAIALIVLGPDKLPSAARTLGKNLGKAKRFINNMQRQIDQEIRLEELNQKIMAQMEETQKFIDETKAKLAVDVTPQENAIDANSSAQNAQVLNHETISDAEKTVSEEISADKKELKNE